MSFRWSERPPVRPSVRLFSFCQGRTLRKRVYFGLVQGMSVMTLVDKDSVNRYRWVFCCKIRPGFIGRGSHSFNTIKMVIQCWTRITVWACL